MFSITQTWEGVKKLLKIFTYYYSLYCFKYFKQKIIYRGEKKLSCMTCIYTSYYNPCNKEPHWEYQPILCPHYTVGATFEWKKLPIEGYPLRKKIIWRFLKKWQEKSGRAISTLRRDWDAMLRRMQSYRFAASFSMTRIPYHIMNIVSRATWWHKIL